MAKGVNSTLVYTHGAMFILSFIFVFEAMLTVFSRFYSDAISKKLVYIERNTCNLFEGSWVIDDNVINPLYNTTTCPFI
uniref:Trichome birefringence-like N-terminal domain-containing protein n=1 Tax=Solanum lycopersicum TaxID=4081 RepID=A0A3Q7H7H9_SOLLC